MESTSFRNVAARNAIVEANLGLVPWTIKRLGDRIEALDVEDGRQVGALGLLRAAEHFDEARGYCFSSFASRCIANAVISAADKERVRRTTQVTTGQLPVPVAATDNVDARIDVETLLNRLPPGLRDVLALDVQGLSNSEIAAQLGISRVTALRRRARALVMLQRGLCGHQ